MLIAISHYCFRQFCDRFADRFSHMQWKLRLSNLLFDVLCMVCCGAGYCLCLKRCFLTWLIHSSVWTRHSQEYILMMAMHAVEFRNITSNKNMSESMQISHCIFELKRNFYSRDCKLTNFKIFVPHILMFKVLSKIAVTKYFRL